MRPMRSLLFDHLPSLKLSATVALIAPLTWSQLAAEETALVKEPVKETANSQVSQHHSPISIIGDAAAQLTQPGSSAVISTEQVRQVASGDINRMLRQAPGVTVREEDGHGLFPNISLRGVDSARSAKVTLMENGIPIAPALYASPSAYFSPSARRMEGIEVRKGISQAKYGPHSTGGVINYLATSIPEETTVYLRSTFGSDNSWFNHAYAGGTWDTASGRWGSLIELVYDQTEGFKDIDDVGDPNFGPTDDAGYQRTEPVFRLSYQPHTTMYQQFELMLGGTDTDANLSYLGLSDEDFAADPHRRYAASRLDNFDAEAYRGSLRYTVDVTDDFGLTATFYRQRFKRDWFKVHDIEDVDGIAGNNFSLSRALENTEALEVLRGEREGTIIYRHNRREYDTIGVAVDGWAHIDQDSLVHDIDFGVRWHMDDEDRFQNEEEFAQDSNGFWSAPNVTAPGSAGNRLKEATAIALYAEDTITLDRWQFIAGLRLEMIEYRL